MQIPKAFCLLVRAASLQFLEGLGFMAFENRYLIEGTYYYGDGSFYKFSGNISPQYGGNLLKEGSKVYPHSNSLDSFVQPTNRTGFQGYYLIERVATTFVNFFSPLQIYRFEIPSLQKVLYGNIGYKNGEGYKGLGSESGWGEGIYGGPSEFDNTSYNALAPYEFVQDKYSPSINGHLGLQSTTALNYQKSYSQKDLEIGTFHANELVEWTIEGKPNSPKIEIVKLFLASNGAWDTYKNQYPDHFYVEDEGNKNRIWRDFFTPDTGYIDDTSPIKLRLASESNESSIGTHTYTLTATDHFNNSSSASINIKIYMPTPIYIITPSVATINEGGVLTSTVTTTNVATGTKLYYALSGTGITTADFSAGALAGEGVTNATGKFGFSHTLANDLTTEGAETLNIKLFTDSARTLQVGSTASVSISDTSTTPPTYALIPSSPTIMKVQHLLQQ